MRISLAKLASLPSALALAALLAACGGTKAKPESPLVHEGPAVTDGCCCKTTPITSVDGAPLYERGANRMECSSKQGPCVDEVQCQGKGEDGAPAPSGE